MQDANVTRHAEFNFVKLTVAVKANELRLKMRRQETEKFSVGVVFAKDKKRRNKWRMQTHVMTMCVNAFYFLFAMVHLINDNASACQ